MIYLKEGSLSPSPLPCNLTFRLFSLARYSELITANATIVIVNPIAVHVALVYLGASVVGKSQVDKIPPEFVEMNPKAIPVTRL